MKVILLTAIEHAREEAEENTADDAIPASTAIESAEPKEAITAALETGGQAWAEKETHTKVESGPWVCGLRKLGELFTNIVIKVTALLFRGKNSANMRSSPLWGVHRICC